MSGLWSKSNEVPHSIRILQVCGGISFLCVDKRREEDRVSDEEDRSVVADQVPVT